MQSEPRRLPRDRAFVLQLRPPSGGGADELRGRVEHLTSGDAVHFESLEELLAFIRRVLEPRHDAAAHHEGRSP